MNYILLIPDLILRRTVTLKLLRRAVRQIWLVLTSMHCPLMRCWMQSSDKYLYSKLVGYLLNYRNKSRLYFMVYRHFWSLFNVVINNKWKISYVRYTLMDNTLTWWSMHLLARRRIFLLIHIQKMWTIQGVKKFNSRQFDT